MVTATEREERAALGRQTVLRISLTMNAVRRVPIAVILPPPPGCDVDGPEGVAVVPPGWLDPGAIVLAVPVGAGAAACVVAGRLAHPLPIAARTSNDVTTRNDPRVAMTPPFDPLLGARCNA